MKSLTKIIGNFLVKDIVIAIIIVVLPFLFYLYQLIPEVKVYKTPFFTIDSNYYEDISVLGWTVMTKLLTLIILSIWFVTCKHWWRYAILVPLSIECAKLFTVINDDIFHVDKYEYLYIIPMAVPLIFLLIHISKKLGYYHKSQELIEVLDDEIKKALVDLPEFRIQKYKDGREQFEELKRNKKNLNSQEYLKQLINLQRKLIGA